MGASLRLQTSECARCAGVPVLVHACSWTCGYEFEYESRIIKWSCRRVSGCHGVPRYSCGVRGAHERRHVSSTRIKGDSRLGRSLFLLSLLLALIQLPNDLFSVPSSSRRRLGCAKQSSDFTRHPGGAWWSSGAVNSSFLVYTRQKRVFTSTG